MNASGSTIEIIDFKLFPQTIKGGAVGMVFGKVTHGMTANFFSELIFPYQIGDAGQPNLSLDFAIGAIRYSLASEIMVALKFLQGHVWFDDSVQFLIVGLEPLDEVQVDGWADEWDASARVDIAFYLDDLCSELQMSDQAFSQAWYYAKICHLYFSDIEIPDVAMTLGILLSQLWWKMDLEDAAVRGNANAASLEKANRVRKRISHSQSQAKNDLIASYWFEALDVHGGEVMRRDSNAAQAVYAIAARERPKVLCIKSTGEVIGSEAIRKRITALRKLGKIG